MEKKKKSVVLAIIESHLCMSKAKLNNGKFQEEKSFVSTVFLLCV